jgi:DNA helicase INO80
MDQQSRIVYCILLTLDTSSLSYVLSAFRHHAYQTLRSTLQHQHRTKLCATISKEYVRLLHRHFRCIRDSNVRGRRLVREVASYWRRAEKESFENRRRAEREEIENRRKATEQKEAERQKKKLEFLLTQTELYSHFIGRKMGIVDAKDAPPSAAAAAAAASAPAAAANSNSTDTPMNDVAPVAAQAVPPSLLAHASTVRNESNVSADEAARSYIANQKAKMAEFDQLESKTAAREAGEPSPPPTAQEDPLDLLNPSTMPQQDSFVQAASSFRGSLKSYQLRGLNWLLNLYEQGINGILADGTSRRTAGHDSSE